MSDEWFESLIFLLDKIQHHRLRVMTSENSRQRSSTCSVGQHSEMVIREEPDVILEIPSKVEIHEMMH